MPTREELKAVRMQVVRLEAEKFVGVRPVANDDPAARGWSALSTEEKLAVLAANVDWEGFDADQRLDMMDDVAEGREITDLTPAWDAAPEGPDLLAEMRRVGDEEMSYRAEHLREEERREARDEAFYNQLAREEDGAWIGNDDDPADPLRIREDVRADHEARIRRYEVGRALDEERNWDLVAGPGRGEVRDHPDVPPAAPRPLISPAELDAIEAGWPRNKGIDR